MNQQETHTLWHQGADAWNRWATQALERKKELQQKRRWKTQNVANTVLPANAFTKKWMDSATARFSDHFSPTTFESDVDLEGFIFPHEVVFSAANFKGPFNISNCIFEGGLDLGRSQFLSNVYASHANFKSNIWAGHAFFNQQTWLNDCIFGGTVWLENVESKRQITFDNSTFNQDLRLNKIISRDELILSNCTIKNNFYLKHADFNDKFECKKITINGGFFINDNKLEFADLSYSNFNGIVSIINSIIKTGLNLNFSQFNSEANISKNNSRNDLSAKNVRFKSNFHFQMNHFSTGVCFSNSYFAGNINCSKSVFSSRTIFDRCTFEAESDFSEVAFEQAVDFSFSKFSTVADFSQTNFYGETCYTHCSFLGPTSFEETTWTGNGDFSSGNVASSFTLKKARFDTPPDFHQTSFSDPIRLDDVKISKQNTTVASIIAEIKNNWSQFSKEPDGELSARFRRLKAMAIESHDHQSEHELFAGELNARRKFFDKPWQLHFWFDVVYSLTSNYGRSIARPMAIWFCSIALFSYFYLTQHIKVHAYPGIQNAWQFLKIAVVPKPHWVYGPNVDSNLSCLNGTSNPALEALALSIRKGLLLPGISNTEHITQTYACLYGIDAIETVSRPLIFGYIPPSVLYAGHLQTIISVALIFLILLGIRNHFKLK